jgi:hypothetical protein
MWQKLKANKTQTNTKLGNEKTNSYVVLDINTTTIVIDNHMVVNQVQMGGSMIGWYHKEHRTLIFQDPSNFGKI